MHLRFSAVCDDARQTPTGRIDVHGVYHDLAAPGFPAKQERLVVVLVLEWDRGDHGRYLFKADLEDDLGNVSLTVEGETEVHQSPPDQPPARSPLIMPIEEVIFPHAGQYTFRVKVKGTTLEGPGIYLMEAAEGQASA
ncbi:MAG: hypothetical protein OEN56_02365 [Gemmatimonadota bacterium]|nr:hypothetical protein [Gemmatimonadota bacterium]